VKQRYVIPLVFVVFLLATGTASAGQPVVNRGEWTWHWEYNPSPCAFPVVEDSVGRYQETYFFDNAGSFIKWTGHAMGTGSISAPGTSTVVLTGPVSMHEEWNEVTQTFTARGLDMAITVPGYGTVFFEAGRLLPDGRIVGNHTFTFNDAEKMAVLCGLLAGE
jgi:hypothetical protein